jgi:acetoin utilization deacetylase AcuC-like enzyme
MTRRVRQIAETYANDRLISVLEGGYDLNGLSRCVEAHLNALLERS